MEVDRETFEAMENALRGVVARHKRLYLSGWRKWVQPWFKDVLRALERLDAERGADLDDYAHLHLPEEPD